MRSTPLLVALAALALPGAAQASTITTAGDGALVYTGGAGSTFVDFSRADDGRIWVQESLDDKVTSFPGSCARDDNDDLYCTVGGAGLRAVMNDGDDSVGTRATLGVPVTIDGGAGNDKLGGDYEGGPETLVGGPGNDTLNGGGGDDVLDGGDGDDVLKGGTGRDRVLGGAGTDKLTGDEAGAIDADLLDGGPGLDTIDGEWSTVQREGKGLVTVTLDAGADDGFAGEADEVRGIEKVTTSTGGRYVGTDAGEELFVGGEPTTVEGRGGDDTIYTSYSNDTVDGGAGNDTIRGYSGDDRITGGPGQDALIGDTLGQTCNVLACSIYSGNDVIDARDGERDSIDCGLGQDTALVDSVDVATNCEDVKVSDKVSLDPREGPSGPAQPMAKPRFSATGKLRTVLARGLTVRVSGAKPGRLAVKATMGGVVVARGTLKVTPHGAGKGVVRFTARARKLLRSQRKVTLRISGKGVPTGRVTLRR